MNTHLIRDYGPQKERLSLGILSLSLLATGDILAGAGDGTVALISGAAFAKKKYGCIFILPLKLTWI